MNDLGSLRQFTRTAERAANQVIESYSTSFGLASRLLGSRHRQHVRNVYALVRVADELVDGMTAEAGLTSEQQADTLERFIAETHMALQRGCSSDLIIHAFAHTARQCGIDEELTGPFFDSMRTDLYRQDCSRTDLTWFDAEAHAHYIYGSAEVVGLMCLRIFLRDRDMGEVDFRTLEHGARKLGAAFQNINFLRDLSDDTERLGRSYLGVNDRLCDKDRIAWVRTIRKQLDDALISIPLLPHDARAAVRSAFELFTALTHRIENVQIEDLYRRRIRVPDRIKAGLAARALMTTWREPRR
jgi:phytoene synthase